MSESRKSAAYLHRRLSHMLEVVRQLMTANERAGGLQVPKDTLYYIQDILDHIQDMEQRLQGLQESLGRSQANYFAKISIDVTQASNRMGLTIKQVRTPPPPPCVLCRATPRRARPWALTHGALATDDRARDRAANGRSCDRIAPVARGQCVVRGRDEGRAVSPLTHRAHACARLRRACDTGRQASLA